MDKHVAVWSGWSGGPGYSNFYMFGDGDTSQISTAQDRIHDFFAAITTCLPTGVTITFSPTVQSLTTDGHVYDEKVVGTLSPPVVGVGGTTFSSASGACINWRTSEVQHGRILRGKTFLVPLAGAAYDTDGTILASRLTDLRGAATALAEPGAFAAEQQLAVWHRPHTGHTEGFYWNTSSATVSDKVAILRSRRA